MDQTTVYLSLGFNFIFILMTIVVGIVLLFRYISKNINGENSLVKVKSNKVILGYQPIKSDGDPIPHSPPKKP